MRSVLFFTENEWAFGQIHHALIKRLWSNGIYAHLLDWSKPYNLREFRNIAARFDLFVTTPCRIGMLVNQYGVPPSKIVAMAHAAKDIYWGIDGVGTAFFDQLGGYAVNHPDLIEISKTYGISRVPTLLNVGIDFDFYYAPVCGSLQKLGYAGAITHFEITGRECKRAQLAQAVAEAARLPIETSTQKDERLHFLAMPAFYSGIDCLLVPSMSETAGLPALEAAAAGKLVISTNVGYFDGSFGEICQMEGTAFFEDAIGHINRHRQDENLYRYVCEYSQQYVRDNFDWSVLMNEWLNVLS